MFISIFDDETVEGKKASRKQEKFAYLIVLWNRNQKMVLAASSEAFQFVEGARGDCIGRPSLTLRYFRFSFLADVFCINQVRVL